MNEKKAWFEEWFESPYYDLLYNKRDDKEAAFFLDNLLERLSPPRHAKILDMPCGKGRHSHYLNQKGFNVLGADLSQRSIAYAKQYESESLSFIVQDMRDPLPDSGFDLALNLFTSFGYFDDPTDNHKVLKVIKNSLVEEGLFVLDYLNGEKLQHQLVANELIKVGKASFHIERKLENGFVIKNIHLTAPEIQQSFQEKVRLFSLQNFEEMFAHCHLHLKEVVGDYSFMPYVPESSDRLIFVLAKK